MKFSIIIPNYNSEKWIEKCLNSILNQTYKNYEIIVVDDISTDNSVNLIKKILRKQDKLIINKSKRLNGGTRNVGIVEATGDYILCMDCDDWFIDENVLQDISNKLNGEDIMFMGYCCHTKNQDIDMNIHENSLKSAFKNVICAIWTRCVKADILKKHLFPEGTLFEDRIQSYKLLLDCKTFTNLDRIIYVWNRENENNTSNRIDYNFYRFNYCGELYRLLKEMENEELKAFIKEELKGYFNSCKEMVEDICKKQ